jgi:glutathione S-transferase
MKYLSVAEARKLPGLRLVLAERIPNPWCIAAKAVLSARHVDYVPVGQTPMAPNEELQAWTGVRDSPVAVLDDEPALSSWIQILMLAERLGSGPSLLPSDAFDRALVIGLSHEICGQDGLGWNRRLLMLREGASAQPLPSPLQEKLMRSWWASTETIARASPRLISILSALTAQLQKQHKAGSAYIVGSALTAIDLYWASFSQFIAPLPPEQSPMLDWNRGNFANVPPDVKAALDPVLMQHRDMIFQRHVGLPLDF